MKLFENEKSTNENMNSMENKVQLFENPEFGKIRTVELNGEIWFVGKDVAKILGYTDTFGALKKHVDEEDKQNCQNSSFESNRGLIVINESGLYSLVLSSKMEFAKKFKRWITKDVIPTIRKTGGYVGNEEMFLDTYLPNLNVHERNLFKMTLGALRDTNEKLNQANEQITEMKPKAEFYDYVGNTTGLIDMAQFSKMMCDEYGIKIGRNNMFKWFKSEGYILSNGMPAQRYMNSGYFAVKEVTRQSRAGVQVFLKVFITGRGQNYFTKKFKVKADTMRGFPICDIGDPMAVPC